MNVPVLTTTTRKRKSPKQCKLLLTDTNVSDDERTISLVELQQDESAVQTDIICENIHQSMLTHTDHLETRVLQLEQQLSYQLFRLSNIADDPQKVLLYWISRLC